MHLTKGPLVKGLKRYLNKRSTFQEGQCQKLHASKGNFNTSLYANNFASTDASHRYSVLTDDPSTRPCLFTDELWDELSFLCPSSSRRMTVSGINCANFNWEKMCSYLKYLKGLIACNPVCNSISKTLAQHLKSEMAQCILRSAYLTAILPTTKSIQDVAKGR